MERKNSNPYTSNGGYNDYDNRYDRDYNQNFYDDSYDGKYNQTSYNSVNNSGYVDDAYQRNVLNSTASSKTVLTRSFLYMVVALIVSGVIAQMAVASGLTLSLVLGGGFSVLLFAELGVVIVSNIALSKNNALLAGIMFFVYSVCNGLTCSVVFYAYSGESIATIFIATAVMFAGIAVVAMKTKKDLSVLGIIGYMGLFALIIVSTFTLLFGAQESPFLLIVGLALFIGITAYDVQKIKALTNSSVVSASENTLAIFGAMTLYLDFINIFLKLLRLFGSRRD